MVKILKKSDSTHSSSKGAVNAYFLTGSFFKKTVVFEAAIFVGQSEDGAKVRCEVSRRVEPAVSRYDSVTAGRLPCVSSALPSSRTICKREVSSAVDFLCSLVIQLSQLEQPMHHHRWTLLCSSRS